MFGENLKKIRKLNKMGQVELAKKLNVANGTISMWENNLRTPDVATIKEISNLFKIPISYLIEDEIKIEPEESKSKTESRLTEKQKDLVNIIVKLNNDDLNQLIGFAYALQLKSENQEENQNLFNT